MIQVARYSTIESAFEALALLADNGIEAKILDSTSNARSWSPHGASAMGDFWILGNEKDRERINELLKSKTGNHEKVEKLSKQFERKALTYLAAIAVASGILDLTSIFETGEAIVTSIAVVTLATWLLNKRKSKQNRSVITPETATPKS